VGNASALVFVYHVCSVDQVRVQIVGLCFWGQVVVLVLLLRSFA
jgi:hypothetical protein